MGAGALIFASLLGLAAIGAALVWRAARRRNVHLWIGGYVRQSVRGSVSRRRAGPVDVLLCIADHFEPRWGGADAGRADARVAWWLSEYPRLFAGFRDSDGRSPRHTFFFPIDEYDAGHVGALAGLCRDGHGEVEIHLHHDGDTAENLERTLRRFTGVFSERHGLLGRWPDGSPAYGFVHGNWALDNSRPDGRWCGVDNELSVLRRTGCYGDFTLPSAPDATQTRTVNSIYYATGREGCCKSHDTGMEVGRGAAPAGSLMIIQGPLGIWRARGSARLRIETGCIQRGQAPTAERLDRWLRARVHVPQRPDWLFVKLHTHGAPEANQRVLLGAPMVEFHRALAARAAADTRFRFHYVTAREMYNLARAAESGWTGPVAGALDLEIAPPGPDNANSAANSVECSSRPARAFPVGR